MRVTSVTPDHTRMVPGFERHMMRCPGCGRVASRLVFGREIEPLAIEPMRLPALTPPAAAAAVWARAVALLRGRHPKGSISRAT